jgi:hypothetical protein
MLGKSKKVTLTSSKGKTTEYRQVTFVDHEGKIVELLLTEREMQSAMSRADKNAEHLEKPGLLSKIISVLIRLVS